MLTDEELLALLRGGEGERVEFTRSWQDNADKIGKAICAFANDLPGHGKPGVIFVGVDDNGKPAGLPITDLLLRRLGEFTASGNIQPLPTLSVAKKTMEGGEVAVVIAPPHLNPPVRHKGECCVRSGPRQRRATPLEEMQLAEKGRDGNQPFDQRLANPPAFLDVLDMGNFRDYLRRAVDAETLAENMRDEEHQLRSHQFGGPGGQLFNGGVLCFAHDADRWLPGAYIQFVRYPEAEMSARPAFHREIRGTIFRQLKMAEEAIEGNITTPAIIGEKTRTDYPSYPAAALRQLISNAVLHRSYEGELANTPAHFYWFNDHIEIRSPGGVYGGIPKSDFGKPGVVGYRNPKLATALKTMGFIDKHGFGIDKARNAMAENGNPPLEFQLDGNRVTVILRKAEWTARAAELACCHSLFHFHKEQPECIRIPGVPPLAGTPGSFEVVIRVPPDSSKSKKDVAIEAVARYTARQVMANPDAAPADAPHFPDNAEAAPLTAPVKMARIMYVLHQLFGAGETEMREAFSASYQCRPSEDRKADEKEFRRLLEEGQPIAAIEGSVAREVQEPRMDALFSG